MKSYTNRTDHITFSIFFILFLLVLTAVLIIPAKTEAMPVFARKYNLSCSTCHSAFPRLNAFGEQFAGDNMRLPNWKDTTISGGDDMLALPDTVPLAIRAQAYVQKREANTIDIIDGSVIASADTDIQSPYQIKLLSSAPLSDHITYYFFAIFAE